MKNVIRIIAAVVDTKNLVIYKENGESIQIPQGDLRVRRIISEATPQLLSHGFADVDIAEQADTTYIEFEQQSNGVVKLFRIAKDKIAALFAGMAEEVGPKDEVIPITLGKVPTKTNDITAAVEEIMQHAVPVSSTSFNEAGLDKQGNIVEDGGYTIKAHPTNDSADTIIAVVDGKIIPGVEKIKSQFARASQMSSTKGIENFLKRLGAVINERRHSVEDLLKFMERGDMPIADDGTILIYKVLNQKGHNKFADCHTSKVEQWVGAYVCMDISLVDHNRNNECSNGLHVARRGYIRQFSGSACVLAKLAPEDVIAVPSYDANKMRVCGYHIIAELSPAQYSLVKQNKPITEDADGKILLGKALAGEHIHQTHEVRITGSMGGGVKVNELKAPKQTAELLPVIEAVALENPTADKKDTPINPKDVVKQVEQLSRKDVAAKLYAEGKYEELKAYKKAAKVSWDKLGLNDPAEWVEAPVVKANPVNHERVINGVVLGEGSYNERIHKLLEIGLTSIGVAQAVVELKKKSKKGWLTLGVSDKQVAQIVKLISG